MDVSTVEERTRKSQDQNSLAALITDNVSSNLILFIHLTKLGKSLKKKTAKMKEKLVSLSGEGAIASHVRFEHPDASLGPKHKVEACVPDEKAFKTFENSSEFKKLTANKSTKKSF